MASCSAEELLDKVRSEIALSREWKELHKKMSDELDKATKVDHTMSNEHRMTIVKKVSETVKELDEYKELEGKMPRIIHQHFFSNPETKKAKPKTQLVDQTSARIIQQWAPFRTHLKTFINIPLPVHLRRAAWNAFLKDKKVKKEFLNFYEGMKLDVLLKKNQKLAEKCKKYLQTSSLSELKKIDTTVYTLCAVMTFWEKRTGTEATKSDILLCFPFIYCCRVELGSGIVRDGSGAGPGLIWTAISEVAEMYCAFMAMMPLNMKNVLHDPKNAAAVIVLCKEVESLLNVSEPKLTVQLNKVLQIASSKGNKSESLSFVFHKQLLHLVHPFVQRMFVGICSLETLCFILDQCFIFLELPKFKFMPYCIATWIILHKRKIMNCHNVESVHDVLAKHSASLTVENFQKEIEVRFLSDIKQGIKIEIDDEDDEQFEGHSLLTRNDDRIEEPAASKVEQQRLLMSSNNNNDEDDDDNDSVKLEEQPQKKSNEDRQELDLLKNQITELLMKQEKQTQDSQDSKIAIERERESYQNDLKEMQKEMASIKERLIKDRETIQKKPVPTLVDKKKPPIRIPSGLPSLPTIDRVQPVTEPLATAPQSASLVPNNSRVKRFDPNSLTSSDVQEINLIILERFNEALYLICHGSNEEKEELKRNLK